MTYLLIAFVLAIILSPLMWFRQSPRQKLITAMRQQAAAKGLRVKLSKPPDAREGEGRLEVVAYTLPWLPGSAQSTEPRMEKWLLVYETRRGDPAPWPGWQWIGRESNDCLVNPIGLALEGFPDNVTGLKASPEGLSVYWRERGDLEDVVSISRLLITLRQVIRD